MIGEAKGLCWCAPDRFVPAAEVVMRDVQRHRCRVIVWRLTEPIGETGKACAAAGIKGLTFHDLRGSAVVRLALADATVPQIATFTGHSLHDVEAILDAHYLGQRLTPQ
jgi:integrase